MVVVLGMADNVKVHVDLKDFTEALREYEKNSSRDMQTLIKGAAIDVAFKAARATPKSTKGDIPKMGSGLFYALASADLSKQSGAFARAAETAQRRIGGQVVKTSRAALSRAARKRRKEKVAFKPLRLKQAARKIRNQRVSATSYSRVLFLKLASQLGAKVSAIKGKIDNAIAKERKIRVYPAVTLRIEGVEARHAREILEPAMQAGINAVAAKYWKKVADKLAKRARAHSGRKR